MNKQDRKTLSEAIAKLQACLDGFTEARDTIRELADAESEKFDNLSEGLQAADRGQAIEQAKDALSEAADELEGFDLESLVSTLEGIGE